MFLFISCFSDEFGYQSQKLVSERKYNFDLRLSSSTLTTSFGAKKRYSDLSRGVYRILPKMHVV